LTFYEFINLSQIMKQISGSYTTYCNVKRKRAGHLLPARYQAFLVDADAYATELSCSIHRSPVRAGIVAAPEDYLRMSYRHYTEDGAPDWLTTGFILGYFGAKGATAREKYRHFVHDLIRRDYSSPLDGVWKLVEACRPSGGGRA
jgi:putative transposase